MKQGFTENPRFHNLTNFIIMTPSTACLHLMINSGNFNILAIIHKKGYQSEGLQNDKFVDKNWEDGRKQGGSYVHIYSFAVFFRKKAIKMGL